MTCSELGCLIESNRPLTSATDAELVAINNHMGTCEACSEAARLRFEHRLSQLLDRPDGLWQFMRGVAAAMQLTDRLRRRAEIDPELDLARRKEV